MTRKGGLGKKQTPAVGEDFLDDILGKQPSEKVEQTQGPGKPGKKVKKEEKKVGKFFNFNSSLVKRMKLYLIENEEKFSSETAFVEAAIDKSLEEQGF